MRERAFTSIGLGLLAVCFIVSLGRILIPHRRDGSTGENITIRIAHWQLESGVREAIDALAKEYEKLHPNVRIRQIPIPERIYTNWLITQLVGGTAPDIVQIGIGASDERLARYFEPLTALVELPNPYNAGTSLDGVPLRETFFDGMQGGYKEALLEYYAIPISGRSVRLYYNLDLLKKITGSDRLPETFREFIELCKKASDFGRSNGRTMVPLAGSKYNGPLLMNALFASQTQTLLERLNPVGTIDQSQVAVSKWYGEGKWSVESPEILSGLRLMREVARFLQPGFMQLQRDDATFYFVQGRALMICSGSWDSTSIRSQAPFPVGVGHLPFPTPDDPEYGKFTRGRTSEAGSLAEVPFGLSRTSKHPEIATDFLLFLASQRANQIWTNVSHWIPSVLGVTPHPDAEPFLPFLAGSLPGVPLATEPDASRLCDTNMNVLFAPDGSPEKFAARLSGEFLEARLSDLRRSLLSTGLNAKRRDTVLASLAVQCAKDPTNTVLADKLDQALQAVNSAARGYSFNKEAIEACEAASNKP